MSKRRIVVGIATLVLVTACGTKKLATPDTAYGEMAPAQLLRALEDNRDTWTSYSARLSFRYKEKGNRLPFTASVRLQRDSILWVSVSAAFGLEVARAQITPDRVLIVNRLKGTYLDSDFESLKRKFGVPVTFNTLQTVFSGGLLFNWDRGDMNSTADTNYYILSNHPPSGGMDTTALSNILEKITIEIARLEIVEQEILDPEGGRYLRVENKDYKWINGRAWPIRLNVVVRDSVTDGQLQMRANKIETDIILSFPFEIPDGYALTTW